ncbi:MAG TPA: type II secretion system F family protein [Chloroflexota bacterium]|nr:type II secretion system F family protein [Chloroflexota bacterium]
MDSSVVILGAASCAAVATLCLFIGIMLMRQPDPVRERMNEVLPPARSLEELELQQPFSQRVVRPFVRTLARLVVSRTPQSTLDGIRHNLLLAGSPGNLDVRDFLGIKGLFGVFCAGLAAFVFSGTIPTLALIGAGAGGAFLGYMLPNLWLRGRIRTRQKEVQRTLPDALDLLTICVEAGLGFEGALVRVTQKWHNAMADEFGHALAEMRMGVSRRDALTAIVTRTDVPDVATFIAAIVQADQLGVSIGRVLHTQAAQMRTQRRLRAEELAHQAPVKMVFPMIFLIFPALYVIILGPAVPSLIDGLGIG